MTVELNYEREEIAYAGELGLIYASPTAQATSTIRVSHHRPQTYNYTSYRNKSKIKKIYSFVFVLIDNERSF
jgi:hypothetical protein